MRAGPRMRTASSPRRPDARACRRAGARGVSTPGASRSSRQAATTVAQAPVPQARVMPQPRSQTTRSISPAADTARTRRWSGSGSARRVSSSGPNSSASARSRRRSSSTKITACGLPIETAGELERPPARRIGSRSARVRRRRAQGISSRVRRGRPISTATVRTVPVLDVERAGEHARRRSRCAGWGGAGGVGLVQHLGDAADAVAAHLGLAAVGVEHAHARVARRCSAGSPARRRRPRRSGDRRARARPPGSSGDGEAPRRRAPRAQVDDDEVVSEPLDLRERQRHRVPTASTGGGGAARRCGGRRRRRRRVGVAGAFLRLRARLFAGAAGVASCPSAALSAWPASRGSEASSGLPGLGGSPGAPRLPGGVSLSGGASAAAGGGSPAAPGRRSRRAPARLLPPSPIGLQLGEALVLGLLLGLFLRLASFCRRFESCWLE